MSLFLFRDEDSGRLHVLEVEGKTSDEFEHWLDRNYETTVLPLEETYGVHDTSFQDRFEGKPFDGQTVMWGFSSYEVQEDKWPELLAKWKDILTSIGLSVGQWQTIEPS